MLRTKWFALHVGYQLWCDKPAGFTLALFPRRGTPKYTLLIECGWNWKPTITYRDPNWHVNEPGFVRGFPVARAKPLRRRTIRSIYWARALRWQWFGDG
jgi:hypothetical protein